MSRTVGPLERALVLPSSLVRAMLEQARREAPREAVGLLFGLGNLAERLVALPNIAADPQRRFEAEPRALLAALQGADENGDALVGLYHSHPRGPALPSQRDLEGSRYKVPTLIVVPGPGIVRTFDLSGALDPGGAGLAKAAWLERDLVVLRDGAPGHGPADDADGDAPARLTPVERSHGSEGVGVDGT